MSRNEEKNRISPLSCENYVELSDYSNIETYFYIAKKLNINILVIEGLSRTEREEFIQKYSTEEYNIESIADFFSPISKLYPSLEERILEFQKSLISPKTKMLIATRKTLKSNKIPDLKKQLEKNRGNFEVIGVFTEDLNVAKWAAHDRRVDYIVVDLLNSENIDAGLCSLVKQHDKIFEISLSSLLLSYNDQKMLSGIIRNGKKIINIIHESNAKYIFTSRPPSPFYMRNNLQLRYLSRLIGVPFNRSRNSVFHYQLEVLVRNLIKLDENYLFEGVEEVQS